MKTLIVEDDRTLADILAFTFVREGYEVVQAYSGSDALIKWDQEQPDLMLLDVNIPCPDGFQVCETIRKDWDTPIIFLTVRDDEEDIIHGLDVGADDYISKPFSPRQLMARVEAVLRRSCDNLENKSLQVGAVFLDLEQRLLSLPDQETITLSESECRFIHCIMHHSGQVVSSQTLINCIWGPNKGNKEMLRQLIHRLRGKITRSKESKLIIENIHGIGYCFTTY